MILWLFYNVYLADISSLVALNHFSLNVASDIIKTYAIQFYADVPNKFRINTFSDRKLCD